MLPGMGAWLHNADLPKRIQLECRCNLTLENKKKDKLGGQSGMSLDYRAQNLNAGKPGISSNLEAKTIKPN